MPVVSLCIEEDGRPRVEIMGGTWVGDARDVGAGCHRRRQDLATAWPLSASGQARAGAREDGVRMCVERVRKRTGLGKEKTKKRKKEKEKRKRKTDSLWAYTSASCHWQFNAGGFFVGRRAWSVACRPQVARRNRGGRVMHTMWVQAVVVETS